MAAGLMALATMFAGDPRTVDRHTTADGRYQVRVVKSTAVITTEWDVIIQRRSAGRFQQVDADCLYSETAEDDGFQSIEPGRVRIRSPGPGGRDPVRPDHPARDPARCPAAVPLAPTG